jgi:hypothetical protein
MDGYQLAADLTKALAWPIAGVVLGAMLRRSIIDLLERVTTLKAGGIEMTVGQRAVTAVEDLTPKGTDVPLSPPFRYLPDPVAPDASTLTSGVIDFSAGAVSVDAMILRSWAKLEAALLRDSPGPKSAGQSAVVSIDQLYKADLIPVSVVEAVNDLRKIRNDVAHARAAVTMLDAMVFDNAVSNVIDAVRTAKGLAH